MAETLENPFANYQLPATADIFSIHQPPELDDTFSVSGRVAILEFKARRLADQARAVMLEDNRVQEFLDGFFELEMHYDCTSLEPFISFSSRDDELAFVGNAVITGVKVALIDSGVTSVQGRTGINTEFDDENPRIATTKLRVFDSID